MEETDGNVRNPDTGKEYPELNAYFYPLAPVVFPYGFRVEDEGGEKQIIGLNINEYRMIVAEFRGVAPEEIDLATLIGPECITCTRQRGRFTEYYCITTGCSAPRRCEIIDTDLHFTCVCS